jgi:uncharacterized protein YprB with RNaseH-like and TPR domain
MIRHSFILLPKVGEASERKLWRKGVRTWEDFISADSLEGVSAERKEKMTSQLVDASCFLGKRETEYFCQCLPRREHWRLYEELKGDAAFLDIETDGVDRHAHVTIVGIHSHEGFVTLTRGEDLSADAIRHALRGKKMLVTFNGSSFDLPMLEKEFPFSVPKVPHMDLRHMCPRVDIHGGLKDVEIQLGMRRPAELEYLRSSDAVHLWHAWKRGSHGALRTLQRYNEQDCVNLENVADHVYGELSSRMRREISGAQPARPVSRQNLFLM